MKSLSLFAFGALVLLAGTSPAATFPGSGTRETLFESTDLSRWSVGGDYTLLKRDVVSAWPQGDRLEVESFGIYAGYRPVPWLTLQGTLSVPDTTIAGHDFNDGDLGWGLGLQANLWRYDLADPDFMNGRYSLRAGLDYQSADYSDDLGGGDWSEFTGALWLHYETFADRMKDTDKHPYSLALFVGPMFSMIDGSTDARIGTGDFEEKEDLGVGGGAELSISHNCILGVTLEYFDHVSYRWSLRYHF